MLPEHRMITGIMAATKVGIIGYKNSLPWDYKNELEHFKRTTDNQTIIMGRKTYDGLPKNLLKTRTGIVFSRNLNFKPKDVCVVNSLEDFNKKYGEVCGINNMNFKKNNLDAKPVANYPPLYMIGGAEIAHLFLSKNLLSFFILTIIKHPYAGDVTLNLNYFNNWDKKLLEPTRDYDIYKLTNNKR